jgi:hypothetical protein
MLGMAQSLRQVYEGRWLTCGLLDTRVGSGLRLEVNNQTMGSDPAEGKPKGKTRPRRSEPPCQRSR